MYDIDILFNTRNHWTEFQINLLITLIHKVKKDDNAFKIYPIKAKEIIPYKMSFIDLKKSTLKLLNRSYELSQNNRIYQVAIVSSITFRRGEGILEIILHPIIKSYFLELKEKYTLVSIKYLLSFKSTYSKRLYIWLKENRENFIFDIQNMKQQFGIEERYSDYNTLKKRIILQAQKELSSSDFPFFFKEIKSSRKVESIQFLPVNFKEILLNVNQQNLQQKLVKDTKITMLQARKIVIRFTKEEILSLLFLIKKANQAGQIKTSLSGYTVGVFNTILKQKI